MTPDEALRLIRANETEHVELKQSLKLLAQGIEALCAFANKDGGTVFFGVRHDCSIMGVSIGENTLENIANEITQNTNPQLYPVIEVVRIDSKKVVAMTVVKSTDENVATAYSIPYVRVGNTNQRIKVNTLEEFLKQRGLFVASRETESIPATRQVARTFAQELSCPANWGMRLVGFPGETFDVLAMFRRNLIYVACVGNDSEPVPDAELENFLSRVEQVRCEMAVFLLPRGTAIEDVASRLQKVLRAGEVRIDKQIELACLKRDSRYIFVSSSAPDIRTKLGFCLRYYGQNVGGVPFRLPGSQGFTFNYSMLAP